MINEKLKKQGVKKCKGCGALLNKDDKVCRFCGTNKSTLKKPIVKEDKKEV